MLLFFQIFIFSLDTKQRCDFVLKLEGPIFHLCYAHHQLCVVHSTYLSVFKEELEEKYLLKNLEVGMVNVIYRDIFQNQILIGATEFNEGEPKGKILIIDIKVRLLFFIDFLTTKKKSSFKYNDLVVLSFNGGREGSAPPPPEKFWPAAGGKIF